MTSPARYGDWRFARDYATAVHVESGDRIKFTRAERLLLSVFTRNARALLPRTRLLDAIAAGNADISDRTVDFTISRLRRKLGDSARNPRYIATQYGEGYFWVAEHVPTQHSAAGAFVVVGPVRGLHYGDHLTEMGWAFTRCLTRELDRNTPPRHRIVLDRGCPDAEGFAGEPPRFAVHLNFIRVGDRRLDCAVTVKRFASSVIVDVSRCRICESSFSAPTCAAVASVLARAVLAAIWRSVICGDDAAADGEPLAICHHRAALLLAKGQPQWDESLRQLEARVAEHPDDHEAAAELSAARYQVTTAAQRAAEQEYRIALRDRPGDPTSQLLLATALHSRYLFAGRELLAKPDWQQIRRDEVEIEKLTLSALPCLQSNGIFALSSAKFLYFANKAHRPLAVELVEHALSTTTAFATALVTAGQIYAWEGRFDEALDFFEQALVLAPEMHAFKLYVQTLRCLALVAMGNQRASAVGVTDLYEKWPATRAQLCLFLAATEEFDLDPTLAYLLGKLDVDSARGHIRYLHYLFARHFRRAAHRRKLMHRPLTLLMERFGDGCIPDEVRFDMPKNLRSAIG